ncbi:hypothetical protein GGR54DRAFT_15514 [Hypoxylon sp. NC1633]|nr:hypothetical protein GGR54DRAFT_15514 [Hypoxylon sp. NC1633]
MSLAPGVSKDGFSYAGDLFAEASGHNRHRRATVAELKDHFKSGSEKDHPAHWFEAQLIHYGLQPSKTKAVARMRLFDAVNGGKLSIPSHVKKIESDLKKEWTKNEREAKKALGDTSSPAIKSAKRKAESSNVDVTVSVGGINITVSANNSAKRTKATAKPATPAKAIKKEPQSKAKKEPQPKPKKEPQPKSKATPSSAAKPKAEPKAKATPQKTPSFASTTATPTARRGGIHQGSSRGSPAPAPMSSPGFRPRTKQTARRSGAWSARGPGRGIATSSSPPDPWHSNSRNDGNGSDVKREYSDSDDEKFEPDDHDIELQPLGLLNGRYSIRCPYVVEQWGPSPFSLILTLSGNGLWARFELGVVSGVMRFDQRPWQSSHDPVDFIWRGREQYGPIMYGNNHKGWIKFFGDGHIKGFLDFMRIEFSGDRLTSQGTRSEVDAATMQSEWNGYNEQVYEEERRARW